jgi:hypothetical protein
VLSVESLEYTDFGSPNINVTSPSITGHCGRQVNSLRKPATSYNDITGRDVKAFLEMPNVTRKLHITNRPKFYF